ncbi:uncharacterized protein [Aphelocoma coerulescens]|uniref:uncharacterized protein n=1 Tax=Aphelocoma coerulescens TaxID=39617 RepID=UPI0036046961
MLSDLERRRAMNQKTVLKAALPGGSSGSLAASAAGREAMPGTGTGDEGAGKASPTASMEGGLEPLGVSAGVSAGRTSPAPLLVPARKPGSHRRGPPRGRNKPTGVKKSLEKSRQVDQTLSDLERRREMEAEAVLKAAFPGGSSGSLAASAAGREAMPGTGTGDWDQDMDYLESLLDDGLKTSAHAGGPPRGENQDIPGEDKKSLEASELLDQMLSDLERRRAMNRKMVAHPGGSRGSLAAPTAGKEELPATGTAPGEAAGTTTRVPSDQKGKGDGFCQGTRCLLEFMAIISGAALVLMLCCVGVWYCWKRKR